MYRANQLALLGGNCVYPNPKVGAVLVFENKIIGEGFHATYGAKHAEVNCIESVSEQNKKHIERATLYCTLEPCTHSGKQPPCADFIIQNKIKKIVIACNDPNPSVSGNGVAYLRENKVEVIENCLFDTCYAGNKYFFYFHTFLRPYVILKWAETNDGFISNSDKNPFSISNTWVQKINQKWRSEEHAILIGKNTVLCDKPALTNRFGKNKNPVRFVLDSQLELSQNLDFFTQSEPTYTITKVNSNIKNTIAIADTTPKNILQLLYEKQIQSLLVEGGALILQSFLDSNLWSEIRIIKSNNTIGKGYKAPVFSAIAQRTDTIGDNIISYYLNNQ